jgi:hypothetical protein
VFRCFTGFVHAFLLLSLQVSLVRNRLHADSDSNTTDSDESEEQQQQHPNHQQQQQQVQSLEILEYRVHAAAGYLAVAVRRQGVCAVDIYKLHSSSSSSSSGVVPEPSNSFTNSSADGNEVTVPAVLLVTNSSSHQACPSAAVSNSSSSNASTTAAAAAAAGPNAITVPNPAGAAGIAELAWVLVLDDPTLVIDLEGLEGPANKPWLAVHVSGTTTPSALYYVQLHTRQQVKVSSSHGTFVAPSHTKAATRSSGVYQCMQAACVAALQQRCYATSDDWGAEDSQHILTPN